MRRRQEDLGPHGGRQARLVLIRLYTHICIASINANLIIAIVVASIVIISVNIVDVIKMLPFSRGSPSSTSPRGPTRA